MDEGGVGGEELIHGLIEFTYNDHFVDPRSARISLNDHVVPYEHLHSIQAEEEEETNERIKPSISLHYSGPKDMPCISSFLLLSSPLLMMLEA